MWERFHLLPYVLVPQYDIFWSQNFFLFPEPKLSDSEVLGGLTGGRGARSFPLRVLLSEPTDKALCTSFLIWSVKKSMGTPSGIVCGGVTLESP